MEKELQDLGLDKKQDISALEPFMRKPEVNPNQSPIMTPKQQAEANKPLSGSAAIQKKLDDMGREERNCRTYTASRKHKLSAIVWRHWRNTCISR